MDGRHTSRRATPLHLRPPHKPVHPAPVERELSPSLGQHHERNRTEPIHLLQLDIPGT
jgi:hypothetical protein